MSFRFLSGHHILSNKDATFATTFAQNNRGAHVTHFTCHDCQNEWYEVMDRDSIVLDLANVGSKVAQLERLLDFEEAEPQIS